MHDAYLITWIKVTTLINVVERESLGVARGVLWYWLCFVLTTRCCIFKTNTFGNGCWKLFMYWNLLWRIEIIQDSHHFSYKYGCCGVPITPYLISKVLVCTALLQVHSSGQKFRPIIWIILLLDKAFLNDENTWVHDIFIVP